MTTNHRIIAKLRKVAASWGGSVVEVPDGVIKQLSELPSSSINSDYSPCPFNTSTGVFWKEKCIMHTNVAHWCVIIHEMGHVFACQKPPDKLSNKDDDSEYTFFGWEYALCRLVRGSTAEWKESNGDYELNNPVAGYKRVHNRNMWLKKDAIVPFESLTDAEKNLAIRERVAAAKRFDLIVNDKPVAIR